MRPPDSELAGHGAMLVTPAAQGQTAAEVLPGLSSVPGTEANGMSFFPGDLTSESYLSNAGTTFYSSPH